MLSLDVESFNQALEGAQGLVIVDFWAPWCGPCRTVTPILEDIEAEYHRSEEAGVEFYKVNVEEVPSLMEAFKLSSIPAVLILKPYEEGGGSPSPRCADRRALSRLLYSSHRATPAPPTRALRAYD